MSAGACDCWQCKEKAEYAGRVLKLITERDAWKRAADIWTQNAQAAEQSERALKKEVEQYVTAMHCLGRRIVTLGMENIELRRKVRALDTDLRAADPVVTWGGAAGAGEPAPRAAGAGDHPDRLRPVQSVQPEGAAATPMSECRHPGEAVERRAFRLGWRRVCSDCGEARGILVPQGGR